MPETHSHEISPALAPRTRTREVLSDDSTTRSNLKDLIGCVLNDRYELIARIKRGGMGTVYLARHVAIGKRVAIKVLSPQYAAQRDVVRRFLQEARATSELRHQHIVDVSDFGYLTSGQAYLVMEYLEGEDLAETVRRDGPLPWPRVAPMLLQVCSALAAAHGCGIIHRDIKPSNCFRIYHAGDPDFVKLLDFGIAKVLGVAQTDEYPVTATGAILGTLDYMAPELFTSGHIDARVDIYAVGMLAYKLLADALPFSGTTHEKIYKIVQGDPLPPSARAPHVALASGVEDMIMRALHRDPGQRFQTIQAFAEALLTQLQIPAPQAATLLKSESFAPVSLARFIAPTRDDDDDTGIHRSSRSAVLQPVVVPANGPPPPTPAAKPPRPRHALLWITGGSLTGALLAVLAAQLNRPPTPILTAHDPPDPAIHTPDEPAERTTALARLPEAVHEQSTREVVAAPSAELVAPRVASHRARKTLASKRRPPTNPAPPAAPITPATITPAPPRRAMFLDPTIPVKPSSPLLRPDATPAEPPTTFLQPRKHPP